MFQRGAHTGDYLVQNISAGGALLVGGPAVGLGADLSLVVRLLGDRLLEVDAVVVRQAEAGSQLASLAVAFQYENPEVEAAIQRVVQKVVGWDAGPLVLIVHRSIATLVALAEAVLATGHHPVLAFTPLEAIRWLCEEAPHVEAVLLDAAFDDRSEGAFVRFLRDDFPDVRRVLVHDTALAAELGRMLATGDIQASLAAPWTPSGVNLALDAWGVADASTPPQSA